MCIVDAQAVLALVLSLGGIFLTGVLVIWQARIYAHLRTNEQKIREKQMQIDAVVPNVAGRTSGTLTNESQRQRLVSIEQAPLRRDLELLMEERTFIKDKLLFAKK